MALRVLDLRGSSTAPTVRQRVTLDGVVYVIELQWNGREGRWFLHLFDAQGSPIALGLKLVANARIGFRTRDTRAPGGLFVVIDRSGAGRDPGIDDLGSRVVLTYRDAADVAALSRPAADASLAAGSPE